MQQAEVLMQGVRQGKVLKYCWVHVTTDASGNEIMNVPHITIEQEGNKIILDLHKLKRILSDIDRPRTVPITKMMWEELWS